MKAINTLNQALELNELNESETTAIVELGELQLALIGGGTGDVLAP